MTKKQGWTGTDKRMSRRKLVEHKTTDLYKQFDPTYKIKMMWCRECRAELTRSEWIAQLHRCVTCYQSFLNGRVIERAESLKAARAIDARKGQVIAASKELHRRQREKGYA